jgi:hypothetical protein
MPNNKKKNKGCGAKKKKKATAAPQAVDDVDLSDLSLDDSYPQRETPAQSLQRILQYKYLSDKDGRSICINLHEKDEEGGDKYVVEYLDIQERFAVNTAYLHQFISVSGLRPDYDRKAAKYPIAMELMDRKPKDLSRKALKCINSVPADKRDVFKKFAKRGEGMSVECTKAPGGDSNTYHYRVILLDCENEGFIINAR